ncbi:hypothetical protein T492DRAFT_840232 [Pavlovales sp. CCMP2436]|nr:hypothetical protein T492DRAFT_840232 [Pavlovales sp. CCMP2436]
MPTFHELLAGAGRGRMLVTWFAVALFSAVSWFALRDGPSLKSAGWPLRTAPPPSCALKMNVSKEYSLVGVGGELNGHKLTLNRRAAKDGVGPTGNVSVSFSGVQCPTSDDELVDAGFTWQMRTDVQRPLLMEPQDGFLVMASGVRITVKELQFAARTTRPIDIFEGSFGESALLLLLPHPSR